MSESWKTSDVNISSSCTKLHVKTNESSMWKHVKLKTEHSIKWFVWFVWLFSMGSACVLLNEKWQEPGLEVKMKYSLSSWESLAHFFSSEHPSVILAHGASLLPPGPGVVWHDARVPLESHHPDRERWPRGPRGSEETGDAPGGEGDEGERPSAARSLPPRAHRLFCVCVCSCNRHLRGPLCMLTVSFFCLCKHISFRWLTLFMPEASAAS